MAKKTYVLDTNVCLTDADCVSAFGSNDIVIPLKVLEEVDKHKKRQDSVGLNARNFIRFLDSLREKGSLYKGVRLGKGKGIIRVKLCEYDKEMDFKLDLDVPDNEIIAVALQEKAENEKRKVILVTRDINMRVKCDSLGLPTEDYHSEQVVKDTGHIFTGEVKHLVDDPIIDLIYKGEDIFLGKDEIELYPNQFVMLISNQDNKKSALARFISYNEPLKVIRKSNNRGRWGITPRNKEQSFAFDLLDDDKVKVVTLIGKAGCGKTLLAIASGLEQVLDEKSETYTKLVVSRPIQPMGKDIGFLPGSLEEKMAPWVAPIKDNLEFLFSGDKRMVEMYMANGKIEVEALTYIRGRSISNAYIIIDEAQNLTAHELKTILTRVGNDTKIILTGDIEQIDNIYIDETSNGLTHAVEKFKKHSIAGHITLVKGERSEVATLASKIL